MIEFDMIFYKDGFRLYKKCTFVRFIYNGLAVLA